MDEHAQFEPVVLLRGRQAPHEVEAALQVDHGLTVGRPLDGVQPGGECVRQGSFGKTGAREVVREQLGRVGDRVRCRLHRLGNGQVVSLAIGLEQGVVGHVLHQRMLEQVRPRCSVAPAPHQSGVE